jgi:hypothetical protein
MKKFFWFVLAVLVVVFSTRVYAFYGSDKVEERRPLKGFERIRLQGSPDIKYTQGKTWSVRVKAPKSIIRKVQTRVEGNCLVVSVKSGGFFSSMSLKGDDVTVYVTSPDLIGVEVHGSGDFESKSHVDTDNLDINLKGSGDIDFYDIICDRINVSLVGSGDVEIKKVITQYSNVELVGSGDVKISQLNAKDTKLELKGSGDIKVANQKCGTVSCRLVGSGDITLTGTIKQLNQTTRGSGDIHTAGLQIVK